MSTYTMASDIVFSESRGRAGFGITSVTAIQLEQSWQGFPGITEMVFPSTRHDFSRIETDNLF